MDYSHCRLQIIGDRESVCSEGGIWWKALQGMALSIQAPEKKAKSSKRRNPA